MDNKKTEVYECKHFEYECDGFEKYCWCHNRESKTPVCNSVRIYAQQFCPFYERGNLRGKWVIDESDMEAARKFAKQMNPFLNAVIKEWYKYGFGTK